MQSTTNQQQLAAVNTATQAVQAIPPLQRSFTLPTALGSTAHLQRPRTANAGVEIGASEGVETLYVHPGARVVGFSTAGLSGSGGSRPGSSAGAGVGRRESYNGVGGGAWGSGGEGGLAWSYSTERTLAAGESLSLFLLLAREGMG